ncbi:MAG: TetR/AcrR family transcriptional regulator [Polyangiaceae bacterium]|nr:TetR/AcrR family transcriptional regulator [Polyangiaceae bacterium]
MHGRERVPPRLVDAPLQSSDRSSVPPAEARGSYHHTGLRQALVDASLELLAERGPRAVTLREVARRAGVSHSAPYRHFSDRSALLAAAAARCLAELGACLSSARRAAGASASAQLEAMMRAYVDFAVSNPGRFRLMFGSDIQRKLAELHGPEAGAVVEQIADALASDSRPAGSVADPQLWAQLAWATMHGLASFAVDAALAGARSSSTSDLLRAAARMIHSSLLPPRP